MSTEPRLGYTPTHDRWAVTYSGAWYQPATDRDARRLLGLLPLDVLDESDAHWAAATDGATVTVQESDTAPVLEFHAAAQRALPRTRRAIDTVTSSVRWDPPPTPDGWLEVETSLHVDAARRVRIEAYLPPSRHAGHKELTVVSRFGRRVEQDVVVLPRGAPTWIDLHGSGDRVEGLVIDIHSAYAEPAGDDIRLLGFVLSDITVTR